MTEKETTPLFNIFTYKRSRNLGFSLNFDHPQLIPVCPKGHKDKVSVRDSVSSCCCEKCFLLFDYDQSPEQQRNYALALFQSSMDFESELLINLEDSERNRMKRKAAKILQALPEHEIKEIDLAVLTEIEKDLAKSYTDTGDDQMALNSCLAALSFAERIQKKSSQEARQFQIDAVIGVLCTKIIDLSFRLDLNLTEIQSMADKGEKALQKAFESSGLDSLKEALSRFYLKTARIFQEKGESETALNCYLKMWKTAFPDEASLENFALNRQEIYDGLLALVELLEKYRPEKKEKIREILLFWLECCTKRFCILKKEHDLEDYFYQVYAGMKHLIFHNEDELALDWLNKALKTAEKVMKEEERSDIKYKRLLVAECLCKFAELCDQLNAQEKQQEMLQGAIDLIEPWEALSEFFNTSTEQLYLTLIYNKLAQAAVGNWEQCRKAAENSIRYGKKYLDSGRELMKVEVLFLLHWDYIYLALSYHKEDKKRSDELQNLIDQIEEELTAEVSKRSDLKPLLTAEADLDIDALENRAEIMIFASGIYQAYTNQFAKNVGIYRLYSRLDQRVF